MEDKRPAPYPLRMTDDLRQNLTDHAKANGRSLNAEIVARLEQSFNPVKGLLSNEIVANERKQMEVMFNQMRSELLEEVKQMLRDEKSKE